MGFRQVGGESHGARIYTNGRVYITRDRDGHNGGGVEAAAGAITGEGATAGQIGAAAFNNAVATAGGVGAGKVAEKVAGVVATAVRNKGAALAVRSGQISPQEAVNTITSPGIDVSGTVVGEVLGNAGGAAVTVGVTEKPPSEMVVDKFDELRE